jgi:hypothetical protein
LRLGKETFGTKNKEELCQKAFAPYFAEMGDITIPKPSNEEIQNVMLYMAAASLQLNEQHLPQQVGKQENENNFNDPISQYPIILTADHISEILSVTKHHAYEMMKYEGFPLIRIGRLKRVNRENFFDWLESTRRN